MIQCPALWYARQKHGIWFCRWPHIHIKYDRTVSNIPMFFRWCLRKLWPVQKPVTKRRSLFLSSSSLVTIPKWTNVHAKQSIKTVSLPISLRCQLSYANLFVSFPKKLCALLLNFCKTRFRATRAFSIIGVGTATLTFSNSIDIQSIIVDFPSAYQATVNLKQYFPPSKNDPSSTQVFLSTVWELLNWGRQTKCNMLTNWHI